MKTVKVQKGFQVTLPRPARDQADIKVGDVVEITAVAGKITVKSVKNPHAPAIIFLRRPVRAR